MEADAFLAVDKGDYFMKQDLTKTEQQVRGVYDQARSSQDPVIPSPPLDVKELVMPQGQLSEIHPLPVTSGKDGKET
jgi:hypothetical protein